MKYKFLLVVILITSCSSNITKLENRPPYNSTGFAYLFNLNDYNNKIIKGKLDNSKLEISHYKLKQNTLLKLINPRTNDTITLRNIKRIQYPDFYKILITEKVANKLNIDPNLPLIEIIEIKKNKSFIAKKAKIFVEEKKISSNAPVTTVEISNISKNNDKKINNKDDSFYILIGKFYSSDTAKFLKKRIIKEIPTYDNKKLYIKKSNTKESKLISGPYNTINLMKNDYIKLKNFGFEELEFLINE
tara:strand:+ start:1463 stop:2200 length:738 start_codon:yes stop_codon:yes gene_type:complete